jgi:hypothetical protein
MSEYSRIFSMAGLFSEADTAGGLEATLFEDEVAPVDEDE